MCRGARQHLFMRAGQWRNNFLVYCMSFCMTPNGIAAPCSSPLPVQGTCDMHGLELSPGLCLSIMFAKRSNMIEAIPCTRNGHKRGPLG